MSTLPMREFLLGAYEALYEDLIRWIPSVNRKACDWDLSHIVRLVRNRGDRYLTIDLPEQGKLFERALDSGQLPISTVPGFGLVKRRGRRDLRPRLFWALWSLVFRIDGSLREDPDPSAIFFLRQLCYLVKKMKMECRHEYKLKAISDLYSIERNLRESTLDWDSPFDNHDRELLLSFGRIGCTDSRQLLLFPVLARAPHMDRRLEVLHGVYDRLCGTLPFFDPCELKSRHGPGAVSDGNQGGNKYTFPNWPSKLQSVFPCDWHVSTNYLLDGYVPNDEGVASKLIAVPKTQKSPRLIASEPICNQWIQQGMARWFIDSFDGTPAGVSCRIDDQTRNQKMAELASFGDGATIDLSSASDRLACYVVERAFRTRPDILSGLMACRTSWLRNALDKRFPELLRVKKFAMMGSALTFPIQTFVFYGMAVAACIYSSSRPVTLRDIWDVSESVSVYGDDIVIPRYAVETLLYLMEELGLKVNTDKSFWTGLFRESCGTDWYEGECVTPAYIRSDFDPNAPASISTVVETSNNFHKVGLWHVADYLAKRIPERLLKKMPIEDGSLAITGLYSFCGVKVDHLRKRWNPELHRDEYRVVSLSAKRPSKQPDGYERLRQYFTESEAWAQALPFEGRPEYSPRTSARMDPVLRERHAAVY